MVTRSCAFDLLPLVLRNIQGWNMRESQIHVTAPAYDSPHSSLTIETNCRLVFPETELTGTTLVITDCSVSIESLKLKRGCILVKANATVTLRNCRIRDSPSDPAYQLLNISRLPNSFHSGCSIVQIKCLEDRIRQRTSLVTEFGKTHSPLPQHNNDNPGSRQYEGNHRDGKRRNCSSRHCGFALVSD
jgi:hypothetical protein